MSWTCRTDHTANQRLKEKIQRDGISIYPVETAVCMPENVVCESRVSAFGLGNYQFGLAAESAARHR